MGRSIQCDYSKLTPGELTVIEVCTTTAEMSRVPLAVGRGHDEIFVRIPRGCLGKKRSQNLSQTRMEARETMAAKEERSFS
jgi:hypothetical protein